MSSNLVSSPGNDLMIVLVDGEGVFFLVEVEDLHQVSVTTNSMSGSTNGETKSFNGFFSSSVDFSWLEKFDFHG